MFRLRYLTAGESHGRGLSGIIEGIPANLPLTPEYVDRQLSRRQSGFGRGGRMKIESDRVEFVSGIRWGLTIGSPIALYIENRDWENWQSGMSALSEDKGAVPPVTRPRPGHADLPGAKKYRQDDIRNILERSSARETAMRVAVGSVARRFLEELGITVGGFVTAIGGAAMRIEPSALMAEDLKRLSSDAEASDVRCPDDVAAARMREAIEKAMTEGYSLGGTFIVYAEGLPVGLGSHIQWDRRLDSRLAHAFMGIQAIKGVEIGDGFGLADKPGSEVMDEIFPAPGSSRTGSVLRKTNHAGGIEGGMTNGMPVVVRAAMKPIPTQRKPLRSVDTVSGEPFEAAYERSDVCAVPAASVIGEAVMSLVIADAFLEKFGGDSMEETRRNYEGYLENM
ncbi:MAG: chorismate synthase [Nitrospirae bacterium]|nr:chorismate synthase [Nitrospirota bacterium]